jgi:hypothetical protein
MIRSEVMAWTAILLVIFFAFVLIPVHERFVDAQGRYTDVSPHAPPRPSWMSGPTTGSIVQPGSIRPVDTSTEYSRTAPPITPLGAPTANMPSAPAASNPVLIPSPTAPAPRISSTLGVGDPSLSGMNARYTSGIIPPSGSPWEGLQGLTEMASVPTNPAFNAQTRPTPPLGTLNPVTPDTGLFGPGPNILRKDLVGCTCASQADGCPAHPQR